MTAIIRAIAAIALAAMLAVISGAAAHAASKGAWVKVEFRFKGATVFLDLPVHGEVAQFCARDLFWSQDGMVYLARETYPEVAKAKFQSMKCVAENGGFKTASTPTDVIAGPKPMPDLAGVELFFADARGKEISKVYQERRAKISMADCKEKLSSLTARYKQMANGDGRLSKMTFLRGECVLLKTFDVKPAN